MAIILTTANRQQIQIEEIPFASGGEGSVHKIISPVSSRKHCVKLYKPQLRTPEREQKILYMSHNPPPNLKSEGYIICWVIDAVYDQKGFAGFLMPLAFDGSRRLYDLCMTHFKPQTPRVWSEKYDRTTGRGVSSRMKLCVNIAIAIHIIHAHSRYVLVDMKPQNLLVTDEGRVSVLDCDSMQIANSNKKMFSAPVATPEYVPVECNHLNPMKDLIPVTWDRFSLAVIFYELLFGVHPYAATFGGQFSDSTSLSDKIKNGLFVHGRNKSYVSKRPPPHENFDKIPISMQSLFLRAFDTGHQQPVFRPSAEDWGKTITHELRTAAQVKKFVLPALPVSKPPSTPTQQTVNKPADRQNAKSGSNAIAWLIAIAVIFVFLVILCVRLK